MFLGLREARARHDEICTNLMQIKREEKQVKVISERVRLRIIRETYWKVEPNVATQCEKHKCTSEKPRLGN